MSELNNFDRYILDNLVLKNSKFICRGKNFMEIAPALGNSFLVLMWVIRLYHVPGGDRYSEGFYVTSKNRLIADQTGLSKETVGVIIRQLATCGVLLKVNNGLYQLNHLFIRIMP